VCNPWFKRTALHQSDTISPQNGKIISGFCVRDNFTFFVFPESCFARFAFAATERFDVNFNSAKLNSFIAFSRLQFNTPAEDNSVNTDTANDEYVSHKPRSTAALNTIRSSLIFR